MLQVLYFYLYSFLGWIAECIYCGVPEKKFINRGFLEGPYCPIYGFGALLIIFLLAPFEDNIVLLFLAGVVATSTLEYITSYLMEKLFHTKWWDYSSKTWNLHGRICLQNSLLFGIMGIVVYYGVHPAVVELMTHLSSQMQLLLTSIVSIGFGIDVITTLYALSKKNLVFHKVEESIIYLHEEFKNSSIYPLTLPLYDKVKTTLTTKNADERLLQAMEHVQERFESFMQSSRHIYSRLSRAFPNRIEEASRRNAQKLFELIRQYKEGNK